MSRKELVCIVCPISCHLSCEINGDVIEVSGNNCPRGKSYAINELTNPLRMLTSTVKINNALYPCLPVMTSKEIPQHAIFKVMEVINTVEVDAPVKINQVLVEDVLGLGVDIIATRTMNVYQENE